MWRRPPEAGRKAKNAQKIAKILDSRKPEKVLFSDESHFLFQENTADLSGSESWAVKSCPLQWASKGTQKDVLRKFQFFNSSFTYANWGMMNLYKHNYVLSTMGVSKESISKFLIGNRFHVKLRILSSENCKQSLRVKSWKAAVTAEKKQTQDYNQNFVTQARKS